MGASFNKSAQSSTRLSPPASPAEGPEHQQEPSLATSVSQGHVLLLLRSSATLCPLSQCLPSVAGLPVYCTNLGFLRAGAISIFTVFPDTKQFCPH